MARKATDLLCVHKSLDPGELFSLLEFAEYEITSVNDYSSVAMQGMVYAYRYMYHKIPRYHRIPVVFIFSIKFGRNVQNTLFS